MTDEYWMKEALKEAELALAIKEVPVGAVVVLDNRIIGRGHNRIESLQDPTAHAEIIAVTGAANTMQSWRLNNASIYVTVEPCPMCAGAIMMSRISKCIFGAFDPRVGALGSVYKIYTEPKKRKNTKNPGLVIVPGILEPLCKSLMEDFFKQLRAREKNKNPRLDNK